MDENKCPKCNIQLLVKWGLCPRCLLAVVINSRDTEEDYEGNSDEENELI